MEEIADSEQDLDSSIKGKQAELNVVAKLLEKGFAIYTPLIDTGIDCLVDAARGNKEIQVKYREDSPVAAGEGRYYPGYYIVNRTGFRASEEPRVTVRDYFRTVSQIYETS